MKAPTPALLCTATLAALALAGCITSVTDGAPGDAWDPADSRLVPSYEDAQPATVTGFQAVGRLMVEAGTPWPSGGGNWVQGDFVYGSALGHGFYIADVSDPENPVLAFRTPEDAETEYARKAEVVTHPDGRLTLALATQTRGMHLWDVTDPYSPVFASIVDLEVNHYVAMVPGTQYVFNNPSRGAGSSNELVDVSDPYNPVVLGTFGDHGCHGTTFRGSHGEPGFRAYCAAIQRTEIWDLDGLDPAAPDLGIRLLGVVEGIDSPFTGTPLFQAHPLRSLHHLATVSNDGTILIIGDEWNGGGAPGACFFSDPVTGLSTPMGAVWFYDIRDESAPQLLGWITPDTVAPTLPGDPVANPFTAVPNCTAHFGEVVPGEDKLVIAWYNAGVLLIDFSDPATPRILDQYQPEGTNVWSARVQDGYVFTSDIARGMDVLRLV